MLLLMNLNHVGPAHKLALHATITRLEKSTVTLAKKIMAQIGLGVA